MQLIDLQRLDQKATLTVLKIKRFRDLETCGCLGASANLPSVVNSVQKEHMDHKKAVQ